MIVKLMAGIGPDPINRSPAPIKEKVETGSKGIDELCQDQINARPQEES